jgi:hypothetical protein
MRNQVRDDDFSLGDHYSMYVQLDAAVVEVARRWSNGGYATFEKLTAPGVDILLRFQSVEAKLSRLGTPDARRDLDKIYAAAESELERDLAPKPPTRAQRAKRLMERVADRHIRGGVVPAVPAPVEPRRGQVRSADGPAPRRAALRYDADGTLLDEQGRRVESGPSPWRH